MKIVRSLFRNFITADTYFPTSSFCRFGLDENGWPRLDKRIGFVPCFELVKTGELAPDKTGLGGNS